MANFVYNSHSGENDLSQWKSYLQQKEFSSDLTSAIHSQTRAYQIEIEKAYKALNSSIDDASRKQAQATVDAANVVIGKLDQGFSELSEQLSEINISINQLGIMLDWRLSQMVDQQRISNLLLVNIALLLRIPDVQKERQYYIEQGFKHYKNAALDDDLYQDALENLLKAEKREKTDYIVLHRVGMIYLYSAKITDLQKAEDYFRKAAKYAVVESDQNAQNVFNILAGDIGTNLAEQAVMPEAVKAIAAESYLQAGIACYAQGEFVDAVELSARAFGLMPSLLEAGFMKAKALAAGGTESEAADVLEAVIRSESFYAVKTTTDGDLAPKPKVQALLVKLRDEYGQKARYDIGQLNRAIETAQKVGAHKRLSESISASKTLEQEFRKGDFFSYSGIIPKANKWNQQVFKIAEQTISERISDKSNAFIKLELSANQQIAASEKALQNLLHRRDNLRPNYKDINSCLIGVLTFVILYATLTGYFVVHNLRPPLSGGSYLLFFSMFIAPFLVPKIIDSIKRSREDANVQALKYQMSNEIAHKEKEVESVRIRTKAALGHKKEELSNELRQLETLLEKCKERQYL